MFKKFLRLIFLFIIAVVVLYIIFWLFVVFLIGQTWKVRNGEKFCVNKEYAIWKAFNDNIIDFCDNKKAWRCISSVKSYILGDNKDLYVHFELSNFVWKTESEINEMVKVDNPKGYIYNLFFGDYENENKYYAKNYSEVISFLKLNYSDCKLTFYTNWDIEKLNNKDKNIFKGLINK